MPDDLLNMQNTPIIAPATALDHFLHMKWKKTRLVVIDHISPFPFPWIFLQRLTEPWGPQPPRWWEARESSWRTFPSAPKRGLAKSDSQCRPSRERAGHQNTVYPLSLVSETLCCSCWLWPFHQPLLTFPLLVTSRPSRLASVSGFSLPARSPPCV